MRIAHARPTLFTLLSMSLFAAACGDEDHNTAKFSTADDAHLRRTIDVIRAGDAGALFLIGAFVSGENRPGCPAIVTSGTVTTITSDCTTEDGVQLSGRIVTTNFEGHTGFDRTKASSVEATDWRFTEGARVESVDGKVSVTPTGGNPDNGAVVSAVIDGDLEGILVHTDLDLTCDGTELCTIADGSWVDIAGVGAASLGGTFRFDEPPTGTITATGAETLVFDVAASNGAGCHVLTIDGARRELCDEGADGKPSARLARAPFAFTGDAHLLRPLAR